MTGNQAFIKKAILVITANLMTGSLAFLYSILLSRELGAEGMGLYGLIFPINFLLLSIITGGMMVAVSRVISEYKAKGEINNIKKTMNVTLLLNLIVSLSVIGITFMFSDVITQKIIHDLRALNGLRLILISTIFMALSNTYKGYFFGSMKVSIPAFIDIFEKLIRILLLLITFKVQPKSSITSLVTASFLIFMIGEFASLVFFFLYYIFDDKGKSQSYHQESGMAILKKILLISIPLMIAELISTSLSTISALIIPRRLMAGGFTYIESLELIGRFAQMAMQIVFFPMIVIRSVISILIPDLTENLNKEEIIQVKTRILSVINFTIQLSLIVSIACILFADNLGVIIYKRDDLAPYIRFLAYIAPFQYVSVITRGILNGLGKQNIILKNTVFFAILETIILYFLLAVPSINIYGLGIALFVEAFITLVINFYIIKQSIPNLFNFKAKSTYDQVTNTI